MILAWTGPELSRRQASDYRTHGRTDTQTDAGNDNTRRPKLASGKNCPNLRYNFDLTILQYIIYVNENAKKKYHMNKYMNISIYTLSYADNLHIPPVSDSFRRFRTMMIMTNKYDLWVIIIIVLNCMKLSKTGGICILMCVHIIMYIWVRSRNCGCLVTWFCYQLIAKPGNKTATEAQFHDLTHIYIFIYLFIYSYAYFHSACV